MPPRPSKAKRRAYLLGHFAEYIALILFLMRGYRVLARRFSVKGGEIDLILQRGVAIIFVEVRARSELEIAANSITATKQQRIMHCARAWQSRNLWAQGCVFRIDALFIGRWRWPRHVENICELG